MKWLKRYCNESERSFLIETMERHGHQGNAFYYLLLELSTVKLEKDPEVVLPPKLLRQKLSTTYKKVDEF